MSPAWILLVLLAAGEAPLPEEAVLDLCSPGSGPVSRLLLLDGAGLREGPEGALLHASSPDAPPISLACAAGRAYLGLREGRGGRILLFGRGEGGWVEEESGGRTRGAPMAVLPAGESLAVFYERRGQYAFALVAAVSVAKPSERPLPSRPSGMELSPEGERVLVAVGAEVRTFLAATGATSVAYLFPGPIDALATGPGVPRLLVGIGGRVLASDPADPATRGTLPIREEGEVEGLIVDLVWTGRGETAAVLTDEPPGISFLSGEDLALLERRDLPRPGRALAALGPGSVAVILEDGEILETALGPGDLSRARPPKNEPLPTPEPETVPEPGPEIESAAAAPEPAAEPAPEPEAEAAAEPEPEAGPEAGPEPEADAEEATEAENSEKEGAGAPVLVGTAATPREPEALVPIGAEETPAEQEPAGGVLAGRVTGQDQLAAVVVLLGPDNVMREAGRYPLLLSKEGERFFLVEDLAPGRYRVMLMGAEAASLATRPRFATVTISEESGARADFEVVRGL